MENNQMWVNGKTKKKKKKGWKGKKSIDNTMSSVTTEVIWNVD